MDSPGPGRFVRFGEDATPVGINVATGAAVIALATFFAARFPITDAGSADVVVAVTVGVFAACTRAPAALALLLVPTWMIMNGFLVNRSGDLSWHGPADVYRFLLLSGAGASGLAFGALVSRVRDLQERWRLGAVVEAMSTEFESTEFESTEFESTKFNEEKHRA